ncbi:hypothetical protein HID58_056339, partial [Brassica napus]
MTDDGGDDSPNPSDQDRTAQEAPDLGVRQNSAGGAGGDSAPEENENSPDQKALEVEGTSPKIWSLMTRNASLSGEGSSKAEVDQTVSNYSLAPESNSWSLVPGQSSPPASPRKLQNTSNDCISPNGFQALQDICEGEIEEDEEDEEAEVADSASLNVGSLPVVVVTNEKTSVTVQRQGGSQRNKGRGAKRGIANSRDLVQALDRVMINSCWISALPNSFVTFESGGVSDHLRMNIQLREVPQGNVKPFKLFNHTASHPRFLEVVDRVGHETVPLFHSRTALQRFQDKLKALKSEMCGLNRNMCGDLPSHVKHAYEGLCAKQTKAMQNPQTSTFEAASDAWEHWHHISGIEEQFYYQKSRVQWLGFGDRNSRFFHKVTQSHNVRNTIRRIVTEDGIILTSPSDIKLEAAAHFENFLNGSPPLTSDVSPDYISDLVDY